MTSKIYNILGSIDTEKNAFRSYTIAVGTCSRYNLVRKADLPLDWTRHTVRDAPLPWLAGANSNPLRLTAVVCLAVRIRNMTFGVPFVVVDQLAVPVLLGTAFIDSHVRSIDIDAQRLQLRNGGSVAIVDAKGEPSSPTRRHGREKVVRKYAKKLSTRFGSHAGLISPLCRKFAYALRHLGRAWYF